MRKLCIILALTAFLFAGCTKTNIPQPEPNSGGAGRPPAVIYDER